ncbi:FAD-binding oxidoreductase [Halocatena halophila]|uniref:FAD-binding oxidoreductase n=1 Tax=Halocatena halophila TaxID=2814576 RepID=UPI0038B289F7
MGHDCSFLSALDVSSSFDSDARDRHSADFGTEAIGERSTPDAVVRPKTTAEVATILEAATDHGVPVTPYAAGTSLEGNPVPTEGGISMNMMAMDDVLAIRPDDLQIDVQPGVIGSRINEVAAEHGCYFPPMPAANDIATIGGMIANDASGMTTVQYGEVHDWILELEVVLADGTVLTAGSKASKTSSGYNLKSLFVGSEGTLGVITRATLELTTEPTQKRGGRAIFPSLELASTAVTAAVQAGIDVATLELIDSLSAEIANAHVGAGLADNPMVFFECHGVAGKHAIEQLKTIFEENQANSISLASEDERMSELWAARRELAVAMQVYDPTLRPLHPGDVTVPISHYPDIIADAKSLGEKYELLVPCFGHAGDGNVHYTVFVDPDDERMVERGEALYREIVEHAIEYGGTATGEHGIGIGKRPFLRTEHEAEGVETMRRLKRALDPTNTLNPGKIFPDD